MTDWSSSTRNDEFFFEYVDPFSLAVTDSAQVSADGSSLTWGYYTDNILTGSLTVVNDEIQDEGYDRLIRVKQRITIDGDVYDYTLATMFVDSSGLDALVGLEERSLDCYSTLWRFNEDVLVEQFYRPYGYNVVQAIRELVEAEGGRLVVNSGVDTERCFGNDIMFDVAENRGTVLNTIAGWIGAQVSIEPTGEIALDQYVLPENKPVEYVYESGANCIYEAGVSLTSDSSGVVNRVLAYYSRESKQDDDEYPLSDSALVELSESHERSFARTGMHRSMTVQVQDPCSHEELESTAAAALAENSSTIGYIEITAAQNPELKVGDVVEFRDDVDFTVSVTWKCMITEIDIKELKPGCSSGIKMKVIA